MSNANAELEALVGAELTDEAKKKMIKEFMDNQKEKYQARLEKSVESFQEKLESQDSIDKAIMVRTMKIKILRQRLNEIRDNVKELKSENKADKVKRTEKRQKAKARKEKSATK